MPPVAPETPRDGEGVAVDVGVVGQEVAGGDDDGRVLGARGGVVDGDRGVVDAGDVDGGVGRVGAAVAVVDRVVEAAVAVAAGVGVGGERDVAAGQVDRPARGVVRVGDRQAVAVAVRVVGEQVAR